MAWRAKYDQSMADAPNGNSPVTTWEYSPAPETTPVVIPDQTQLYVGGKFIEPHSKKRFATVNPATEAILSNIADGDAAERRQVGLLGEIQVRHRASIVQNPG